MMLASGISVNSREQGGGTDVHFAKARKRLGQDRPRQDDLLEVGGIRGRRYGLEIGFKRLTDICGTKVNRPCWTISRSLSLYGLTGVAKSRGGFASRNTARNEAPLRSAEYFSKWVLSSPGGIRFLMRSLLAGLPERAQIAALRLSLGGLLRSISRAKNAATNGEYVLSRRRVGAPWCCIRASQSRSASIGGGWTSALGGNARLKSRRRRRSMSGSSSNEIPQCEAARSKADSRR